MHIHYSKKIQESFCKINQLFNDNPNQAPLICELGNIKMLFSQRFPAQRISQCHKYLAYDIIVALKEILQFIKFSEAHQTGCPFYKKWTINKDIISPTYSGKIKAISGVFLKAYQSFGLFKKLYFTHQMNDLYFNMFKYLKYLKSIFIDNILANNIDFE